jgi:hypothetical protein
MSSFFIGVDLGQKNDPTAVAVLQRFVSLRAHQSPVLHSLTGPLYGGLSLHVRHVERLPLGAPYPRVVERIREIVSHDHLAGDCSLAVDATGLGAPVVDMLRAARLNCDISPVNITGGDKQSRSGKTWNVPKRDLLASLQLPLEHGQLKLAPGLKLMANLIREFTDFRSTTNSSGHVRLGADGSGEHDDIVIAIALACWRAQRREVSGDAPDRPFNSNNTYNSVEDYDAVLRFHTRR